jgi:pimeloyl-ACP methyl ester carboxylesterase
VISGFTGNSAHQKDVVTEPWYGHVRRVSKDAPGLDAFAMIPKIEAPVLGLYGDKDSSSPGP